MSNDKQLTNIEYQKILYVTDLSESGRKAFPHAASVARRCNSHLTVFHVVSDDDLGNLMGYVNEELWQDLTRRDLEDAKKILMSRKREHVAIKDHVHQLCKDCLDTDEGQPTLTYEVKVAMGDPLEKILDEAHAGTYDLLVIAKHGNRFTVKDAVMGDTARRVVRRSQVPVLVVPLPE